eukprot:7383073-Prymnesium_polylepis.1
MRISRWSTTSRAKATRVTMTYSRPPSSPSSQVRGVSRRILMPAYHQAPLPLNGAKVPSLIARPSLVAGVGAEQTDGEGGDRGGGGGGGDAEVIELHSDSEGEDDGQQSEAPRGLSAVAAQTATPALQGEAWSSVQQHARWHALTKLLRAVSQPAAGDDFDRSSAWRMYAKKRLWSATKFNDDAIAPAAAAANGNGARALSSKGAAARAEEDEEEAQLQAALAMSREEWSGRGDGGAGAGGGARTDGADAAAGTLADEA